MTITITLEMNILDENGAALDHTRMIEIADLTASAVRNRLFGEGFLPDDVYAEDYTVTPTVNN